MTFLIFSNWKLYLYRLNLRHVGQFFPEPRRKVLYWVVYRGFTIAHLLEWQGGSERFSPRTMASNQLCKVKYQVYVKKVVRKKIILKRLALASLLILERSKIVKKMAYLNGRGWLSSPEIWWEECAPVWMMKLSFYTLACALEDSAKAFTVKYQNFAHATRWV